MPLPTATIYGDARIADMRIYNGVNEYGQTFLLDAAMTSQEVSDMLATLHYTVKVTMQNNGTQTWTLADGFKLYSQNAAGNTTWGFDHVDLDAGDSIATGQSKTFTFIVTAPAAGSYNFQWIMRKGSTSFGSQTTNVAVTVSTYTGTNNPPAPEADRRHGGS